MEDIKLNTLIINQLTKEQYDSIVPEENQIYLVEDDKTVEEKISDAISDHNESGEAHADIRDLINETQSSLTQLINTKQDALTAGDHITIINNVISTDAASVIVKDWRI